MPDALLVDFADGVLTLTINRPDKRNAIDAAVLDGLEAGLQRARRDADVRVVVLRGAGGYFSAGIDLPYAREASRTAFLPFMRKVGDVAIGIHRLPVPSISVVEGGAYGLACNLVLACDLTKGAGLLRRQDPGRGGAAARPPELRRPGRRGRRPSEGLGLPAGRGSHLGPDAVQDDAERRLCPVVRAGHRGGDPLPGDQQRRGRPAPMTPSG